MTKYYVTNANGDWWTMEKGAGDTLWLISEDKLKEAMGDDVSEIDDISGDIIANGVSISLKVVDL